MSALKSLKGTFTNVQLGITKSFKSLRSKEKEAKLHIPQNDHINLDVGADLLNSFQEDWKEIHEASEENARKAEGVDDSVTVLFDRCEKQNDCLCQIMAIVSGLPQLVHDMNRIVDKIGNLEVAFSELESEMLSLEDVSDKQDLFKNKLHHQYQLSVYKQRRNVELEQEKAQLASDHVTRMQGYEAKIQERIRERQQVFEQEFSEEMENYKLYGNTERLKPISASSGKNVELSDISIEEDTSALDAFLQSTEEDPGLQGDEVEEDKEEETEQKNVPLVTQDSEEIQEEETSQSIESKTKADTSQSIEDKTEADTSQSIEDKTEADTSSEKNEKDLEQDSKSKE